MGPFRKSRSFNAVQGSSGTTWDHTDANDGVKLEETSEDLQETITALRQSIASHASANAETLENFSTLKRVHDALYSEHLSLQEQMDDAVELLKYLKEEKSSNETKIKELSTEIEVMKESASGNVGVGVVSSTIENLTKEKMQLEDAVKVLEESKNETTSIVERYELERNEIMEKLSDVGLGTSQVGGLAQKINVLYDQALSQKDQIRKLEDQSNEHGKNDAKLKDLLSSMAEQNSKANESIANLQLEKASLMKEHEAMKSELANTHQQEKEIRYLNEKLSETRERDDKQVAAEEHNELLLENESLKCKVQDLLDRVESLSESVAQKDELQALLERDMQERLAKKLAEQLQESKATLELQIRKELEEEYQGLTSSRVPSTKHKSRSFHDGNISTLQPSVPGSTAPIQLEIEKNLQMQLQKVKEERERWTQEQEEFQAKVLLSQQQLSQVRDGYKKKLDRERARVQELESAVLDRESAIEKLSNEYQRAMDDLDELQMTQSDIKEILIQQHEEEIANLHIEIEGLQNGEVDQNENYNKLKMEMDSLVEKYNNNNDELQNTLSQLEQLNIENKEYSLKLEAFDSAYGMDYEELQAEYDSLCTQHNELNQGYESQKQELATTLQELETLNDENEEFLNKNIAVEIAIEAEKKAGEELRKKLQTVETDLNAIISNSVEEREQLQHSTLKLEERCLETEEKLAAALEEIEQRQNIMKQLEANHETLAEERDALQAELNVEREGRLAFVTCEREDLLSKIQVLTNELEELRSTVVSSEVLWQDRLDSKMNEMSASHEEALHDCGEKINALKSEIKECEDRNQVLMEEKAKLSAKDTSQTTDIKELEQEKNQLVEDLREATGEKEALSSAHSKEVEALISEKVEVSAKYDIEMALLSKERDELVEKISDVERATEEFKVETLCKIDDITKERDHLLERANAAAEISNEKETLHKEKESMREMLKESDKAKQELKAKLGVLDQSKNDLVTEYERQLVELSSTVGDLMQEKIKLSTDLEQMKQSKADLEEKIDMLNMELERQKAANSELTNIAKKESSTNLQKDFVKLKVDLDNAQDRYRVLEGGLEDLQLEKEDIEAENEELASKLADLTTQAKTMLVRNEEMENQLDELAMEYDCRVSDLERQLFDSKEMSGDKRSHDENEEFRILGEKHDKALETIAILKKSIDEARQMQIKKDSDVKRLEEESLELRQVVGHLQSENDATREIKYIVLDLKTKNMELTETLRKSRQQKRAAAEIIERLKSDNDKLNSDIRELQESCTKQLVTHDEKDSIVQNQLVSLEANLSGDENKNRYDVDAELTKYKYIVDKMMSERTIFAQRLAEMMNLAPMTLTHSDCHGQIKSKRDESVSLDNALLKKNGGTAASFTQDTIVPLGESPGYPDEAMQNLSSENVDLAERLGGALAEKEFAMTTLSKLGSKLEELVERNKLLESIADLKSSYAIREGSIYSGTSGGHSQKSQAPIDTGEHVTNSQKQSSTEVNELADVSASILSVDKPATKLAFIGEQGAEQDFSTAFGNSTIVSYEMSVKKLEPEQYVECSLPADVSVEKRRVDGNEDVDKNNRLLVSENVTSIDARSTTSADLKLIKVPGGEYRGQLNSRGEKHGNGRMKYDNGNEYDGQWKNNKRDGKGSTRYASGNVYIGMWKGGKRHGFGVFHIYKSGDIYRGNWSGGIKNGPGVYEYADGELDVSFYTNDVRVGDGVRWNADRSRASRLFDGKLSGTEGDFPVDDAMRLTKKLGFVV